MNAAEAGIGDTKPSVRTERDKATRQEIEGSGLSSVLAPRLAKCTIRTDDNEGTLTGGDPYGAIGSKHTA